MNLKVIYEDNHLIVVEKRKYTSTKDISNDLDLISIIKDYIKKKDNKKVMFI